MYYCIRNLNDIAKQISQKILQTSGNIFIVFVRLLQFQSALFMNWERCSTYFIVLLHTSEIVEKINVYKFQMSPKWVQPSVVWSTTLCLFRLAHLTRDTDSGQSQWTRIISTGGSSLCFLQYSVADGDDVSAIPWALPPEPISRHFASSHSVSRISLNCYTRSVRARTHTHNYEWLHYHLISAHQLWLYCYYLWLLSNAINQAIHRAIAPSW